MSDTCQHVWNYWQEDGNRPARARCGKCFAIQDAVVRQEELDRLRAENALLVNQVADLLQKNVRLAIAEQRAEKAEAELAQAPRNWHCDTHGPGKLSAWGCPACVLELREDNATLSARVKELESAVRWALGYDEGPPEFDPPKEPLHPKYWWRTELRRRAALEKKP